MESRIQVTCRQVDISSLLVSNAKNELKTLAEHYKLPSPVSGTIVFSKPLYALHVEVSLTFGRDAVVRARAEGETAYFAFDSALKKLKQNLQKYKDWFVDNNRHRGAYRKGREVLTRVLESSHDVGKHPPIVAETKEILPMMPLSDAVALMELEGKTTLLFRNEADHLNVLYRRDDGAIGWIDSELEIQG